ncbi:MAG: replication factor C large subunit [Candidatus Micrarchaeaceae archaeon]
MPIDDFYSVERLDDLVGNEDSIKKLELYASEIESGRKRKPLLVYGPSGTGKTAAVGLLAKKNRWNIIEFNAGDYRDSESISSKLLPAATSTALFRKHNLILLDEIDELAMRFDKGASAAIIELIEKSRHPIVFTANDRWSQKISFLRDKVDYVEFYKIDRKDMLKLLKRLCLKHAISASEDNLNFIVGLSNGDARSAINDLLAIADTEGDASELIGVRDRKIDIFNLLDHIFMANSFAGPLRALSSVDMQNDMLLNWVEENLPSRYTNAEDLSNGFDMLARASMFYSIASRSQYYTYWRYANAFMASGVALAKERNADTLRRYAFPRVIKSLSATKLGRGRAAAIAAKLQRTFHSSRRRIISSEMHMIAQQARGALLGGTAKEDLYDRLEFMYGLGRQDQEYLMENF